MTEYLGALAMSFKYINKTYLIVSAILLLTSCNLPLNEAPPQDIAPQANINFEKKCLADVLPTMSGFVEGTAEAKKVDEVWSCFGQALDLFYRKVRGREAETYSAIELGQFFEQFFFDNLTLTPGLRVEVMKIKQLLVGGSLSHLTREELQGLITFAQVAKMASLKVLPYMKYISGNWELNPKHNTDLQMKEFEQAGKEFQFFITTITQQIQRNNIEYELLSFPQLIEEVGNLYGKQWGVISSLRKYMPIIHQLKQALIGGKGPVIASHEWISFGQLISQGYLQFLRFNYFIKNLDQDYNPIDKKRLSYFITSAVDFFVNLVTLKPNQKITLQEIQSLFNTLTQVFPEITLTDQNALQIFSVKKSFLGGLATEINLNEIREAKLKIEALDQENIYIIVRFAELARVLYSDLKPWLSWLNLKKTLDPNIPLEQQTKEFQQLSPVFNQSLQKLGLFFESHSISLNIKELPQYLRQANQFFDPSEWLFIAEIERNIEQIGLIKQGLIGGSPISINGQDWSRLTHLMGGGYYQYLQFHHFIRHFGKNPNLTQVNFIKSALETTNSWLLQFLNRKPTPSLTITEIENILKLTNSLFKFEFDLALPRHFFVAKRLFIQGPLLTITTNDSIKLKDLLNKTLPKTLNEWLQFAYRSSEALVQLTRHKSIYGLNFKISQANQIENSLKSINQAQTNLLSFAETISRHLMQQKINLNLAEINSLLLDISQIYNQSWSFLTDLKNWLPAIQDFKKIFVGGQSNQVLANEWPLVTQITIGFYNQFLNYYYLVKTFAFANLAETYRIRFFNNLLQFVAQTTNNKPNSQLTLNELLQIFNLVKQIDPTLSISPKLITEIMHLKVALLKGLPTTLTPKEIRAATAKIETIFNIIKQFKLFEDLYTLDWKVSYPLNTAQRTRLQQALANLNQMIEKLIPLFESSYDLKRLNGLILEWHQANPWPELIKLLPSIYSFKYLITASQNTEILITEWPLLLKTSGELGGDFYFYYYLLNPQPSWKLGLTNYQQWVQRLSLRLQNLIQTHKGVISYPYLDHLVDSITSIKSVSLPLDAAQIKKLYRLALNQFLIPFESLKVPAPKGFATIHLNHILEHWNSFSLTNNWIEQSSPARGYFSKDNIKNQINSLPPLIKLHAQQIWINPSVQLLVTQDNWLEFNHANRQQLNRISMQHQNLIQTVLQILIQPFSDKKDHFNLTKKQYDDMFVSIFDILVQLNLVEASNTKFGNSRFFEANLFTPSANGNQTLELAEAVEIVQFVWSGLVRNNKLFSTLTQRCPAELINEKLFINADCWINESLQQMNTIYQRMPHAIESYELLDASGFRKTWSDYLLATGGKANSRGQYSLNDISLVPHLVQYIESLFYRFDHFSDLYLSHAEALSAYPIFKETLVAAADSNNEKMLRGGFAYLLVYKKLPKSIGEKLRFVASWIHREDSWPIWVNRPQLAEVLKSIAEILGENKDNKINVNELENLDPNSPISD